MIFLYIESFFKIVFLLMLALVSIVDIKKLKIRNIYPLSIAFVFILYALAANDVAVFTVLSRLLFALLVLFFGFVLWLLHFWGAGDAKLLATIALWFKPYDFFWFLLSSAIFMGLLSLIYWFIKYYQNNFAKVNFFEIKKTKIPCAAAFFFGVVTVFLSQFFS